MTPRSRTNCQQRFRGTHCCHLNMCSTWPPKR